MRCPGKQFVPSQLTNVISFFKRSKYSVEEQHIPELVITQQETMGALP